MEVTVGWLPTSRISVCILFVVLFVSALRFSVCSSLFQLAGPSGADVHFYQ
jgi:hypothetical protein